MKTRSLIAPALAVLLTVFVAPAFAQQRGPSPYDPNKKITLNGTVEEFDFGNSKGDPNSLIHIHLAVKGKDGQIQHWVVEAEPPVLALQDGWTKDMLKPGDQVTYEVSPAVKGGFRARGGTTITVNGKKMGDAIRPETVTIPAVHVQ